MPISLHYKYSIFKHLNVIESMSNLKGYYVGRHSKYRNNMQLQIAP